MSLGNNLFKARKKKGLSQEEAAEKLGVSRQTISKWEVDETLPDIRQSKKLAVLYGLSLDELIEFDIDEIQTLPQDTVELAGEDMELFERLMNNLNNCDDVDQIYHNVANYDEGE